MTNIICYIIYALLKLFSEKAKLDQCMNANDSSPVGVLRKSSCKITTKDKHFSWRKQNACYCVLNGKDAGWSQKNIKSTSDDTN